MASKIIWTKQALLDRQEILDFWFHRNGNKRYSRQLDLEFRRIVKLLGKHPSLGKKFTQHEERFLVKGNYLIIYTIINNTIEVRQIWDARRNPGDLKL